MRESNSLITVSSNGERSALRDAVTAAGPRPIPGAAAKNRFVIDIGEVDDATAPFDVGPYSAARITTHIIGDDTYSWTFGAVVTIQTSTDGLRWVDTATTIIGEGETGIIDCRGRKYLRAATTTAQGSACEVLVGIHADESDPTANAASDRGSSFPSDPEDGQYFYRTDHETPYWYDAGRGHWLGPAQKLFFGRNSSISNGESIRSEAGDVAPQSTTRGWDADVDYVITAFNGQWVGSTTGSIDITADATSQGNYAFTTATTISQSGLDLDIDAGEIPGVDFNYSSGSPNNPAFAVTIRRRAD